MKRNILLAASLVLILSTTTGFFVSKVTRAMVINIHAKDLPENGLHIIRPSDPDFDIILTSLPGNIAQDELEALKPLSVAIQNMADRTVVAHAITWECIGTDGKKASFQQVYANSEPLTDGEEALEALSRTNLDRTIKPGAALLISLLPLPTGGGYGFGASGMQDERHQGQDAGDSLQSLSVQLQTKCTDITVSIDGAFFDDGTFAGPDTTNFFSNLKAQVEAKREVMNIILENHRRGKSTSEIFQQVEADAISNPAKLHAKSSETEHYNFFKKIFAMQFLQQKKARGENDVFETISRLKNKGQPTLRKINKAQ